MNLYTYHTVHQPCPVDAGRLDPLEEVNCALCLQPLQLGVEADEGASATHTIAGGEGGGELAPAACEANESTDLHMTVMVLLPVVC